MEHAGDCVLTGWELVSHLGKTLAWMFRNNWAVFRDMYFGCVEGLSRRKKDRFFFVAEWMFSVVCCLR